jgi:hypothetical protein
MFARRPFGAVLVLSAVMITSALCAASLRLECDPEPSQTPDGDGGIVIMSYDGAPLDHLALTAIEDLGTNGVRLTLGYPDDYTNRLDVFSCTNLMPAEWTVETTTPVNRATNCFEWTDSGTVGIKFYTCGNGDYDSDSDGLTDAREQLVHRTNPDAGDTDADGLTDGAEVNTYATDPLATDTDGDGLPDGLEVSAGANPLDGGDLLVSLEWARARVLGHWYMVESSALTFTNTPGSAADLADMRDAINTLSGKFVAVKN